MIRNIRKQIDAFPNMARKSGDQATSTVQLWELRIFLQLSRQPFAHLYTLSPHFFTYSCYLLMFCTMKSCAFEPPSYPLPVSSSILNYLHQKWKRRVMQNNHNSQYLAHFSLQSKPGSRAQNLTLYFLISLTHSNNKLIYFSKLICSISHHTCHSMLFFPLITHLVSHQIPIFIYIQFVQTNKSSLKTYDSAFRVTACSQLYTLRTS